MDYINFEKKCNQWKGKVCLYGAGLIGKTWGYDVIVATGLKPDFYCDKRYGKDDHINGLAFVDLNYLESIRESVLVFMTLKEEYQKEVKEELMRRGINNTVEMGDSFFQGFIHSIQNSGDEFLIKKYEHIVDDKKYIERRFEAIMGYKLNLDDPRTFNEKIQWLKLNDRKPVYTTLVDKATVKDYVARIIGYEHIIPTIGIWDRFEDIDFGSLPNQFVLKCTHDSGGIVICYDKTYFEYDLAKEKLNKCLDTDYYLMWREWPYKNVKPRIIAEPFFDDSGMEYQKNNTICYDDEPKIVEVDYGGFAERKRNVYGLDWEKIDAVLGKYKNVKAGKKSKKIDEMIFIANSISKSMKLIKTDFYLIDDQLFFCELTFYQEFGLTETILERFGIDLNDLIRLSNMEGELIKKDNIFLLFRKCNLSDYKVYCFNGKAKWISYITGRNNARGGTQDFYDLKWNYSDISMKDISNSRKKIKKPVFIDKMIELSEKISNKFGLIRCDWYFVGNQLYFGEITFYDGGGFVPFNSIESDLIMGSDLLLEGSPV